MITIKEQKNTKVGSDSRKIFVEMRGLSTDEKPITFVNEENCDIENGSSFIEIDTGKIFLFDLENKQWKEI